MHIKSTFIHLNKVGLKTEKELWAKMILTWEDYQTTIEKKDLFFNEEFSRLKKSFQAFNSKNIDFFAEELPKSEYYRLALSFPEDVIFLDIETTGLSQYYDHITMIGWSIDGEYDYYVHGINNESKFREALKKAKIIVTFNGSIFDIPFIKNYFEDIETPLCHIDLRFFAKKAGLSGGQKSIEDQIGFKRNKSLKDTNGYMATVLWDEYKWGKKTSLEKLIAYNHSDVEGMKSILDYCIKHIYKTNNYRKLFDPPFKFTSLKSKLDKSEIKQFIQNSKIPFDPMSALKYKELAEKIRKDIAIVGIDLTGSEQRPTGVALLRNNQVETLQINTDDDMIDYIIQAKPDIVSIDSPLSLPLGRISVFDDDPGRDKYGILRICERVLKKRGVNAYPTLLPSMQKLTKRGIKLAERLRKLGIPTIESYPGVVQDIIGLPRKQASLKLLKQGLGKFGLTGEFLKKDVSHDEIDAITSAIVGLFFLSKDYEAIGELRENLMIIPDLKATHKVKKVFGISGQIAAGKTTAANFLKKQGFKYTRYSLVLKDLLEKDNKEVTRENLQELGSEMSKNQTEFAKKVYEEVSQYDNIVIDGLRHPEDFAFFFEQYGFDFKLIHITADEKVKEERYIKEGHTIQEYQRAIKNEVESDVPKLKKLAYKILGNNGTIEQFEKSLNVFVEEGG
jgi:uncharacterized protein YprB with RNaseH-like and TPR domain/predicted nuclease with RNAse H fold/dephospho-CoA kinase